MPDTLLYMSYGRDCYHQETMFSILSARRFMNGNDGWKTLVYTDRPSDYAWLDVETRELTSALMEEWIGGEGGYPFRRKVACIMSTLETNAGKLAFLDGDTYFRRSPQTLFDRIRPGRACLHLRELRMTRRAGTAGLALGRLFDREILRDPAGRPVRLQAREGMWNSGVIGIDRSDAGKVSHGLALIDAIWAYEQTVHTLEQFALGHVFAEGRLSETDDVVFHYWHHRQRAPFLTRLPDIISRARQMPLAQAAEWSYAQRPTELLRHRLAGMVRDVAHQAGLDHRWTRVSF